MIKNIFIPEKIGPYYIFAKRIAGIEIGPTEIQATITRLQGTTRTIEKLVTESIETETAFSYDVRVSNALKALSLKLGSYDELCCIIPSAMVVFKELSLPFTGLKKIKMVVPFEVEPLLPFTLDTAVIDSIITHEDTQTKQTNVLVAAVKRDILETYMRYFQSAGITVEKLSIDMFELFGLYTFVTQHSQKSYALIDLNHHTTRIAVIIDQQLKHIRTLPKGLLSAVRKLSAANGIDIADNLERLTREGFKQVADSTFSEQAQQACTELLSEIKFTIDAYTQKLKANEQPEKIVLAGSACDIPHMADFMSSKLESTVQLFQAKQVVHSSRIKSLTTSLPNSFILSLASSLATPVTEEFNLSQYVEKEESRVLNYQLIALAALLSFILTSFTLYSFLRIRNLRLAYKQAETEALNELKNSFKLKPGQSVNLQAALKGATNELVTQEAAWRHLSEESRYAFLRNLTELSRCISTKDTQLDLTSIVLSEDTIKLYGSVPGYQQLIKLQNQLECPLFKKLPKLQDWSFKSEPITLTVQKEEL